MKKAVRNQIKVELASLSARQARDGSAKAAQRLMELPEFHDARTIMAYLPIPGEIDTTSIILKAWQDDKTVLVPKVSWDERHMVAVELTSLDAGLVVSKGLREPADAMPWPAENIDFVIVPAIAFDRHGHRLGRGGGFYDRFFAQVELAATRCGLAHHLQLMDELPRHGHDQPMDIIVTDVDVLRFDRSGSAD